MKPVDYTGKRFGWLTVIERVPGKGWNCQCVCGGSTIIPTTSLGRNKSCGCKRSLISNRLYRKHVGYLRLPERLEDLEGMY